MACPPKGREEECLSCTTAPDCTLCLTATSEEWKRVRVVPFKRSESMTLNTTKCSDRCGLCVRSVFCLEGGVYPTDRFTTCTNLICQKLNPVVQHIYSSFSLTCRSIPRNPRWLPAGLLISERGGTSLCASLIPFIYEYFLSFPYFTALMT